MKPRLWRVAAYSRPGFPKPTITFTADVPFVLGPTTRMLYSGRDFATAARLCGLDVDRRRSQRGHPSHVRNWLPGDVHRPGRGAHHFRPQSTARTGGPGRALGPRFPAHE